MALGLLRSAQIWFPVDVIKRPHCVEQPASPAKMAPACAPVPVFDAEEINQIGAEHRSPRARIIFACVGILLRIHWMPDLIGGGGFTSPLLKHQKTVFVMKTVF
ncbi:MAG: hypothetical protein Q7P63_08600 [Verrucomicrobiota bacterium JB022]|nr:hypothetical protein [Verrucomicrobiota bacterium JB022]